MDVRNFLLLLENKSNEIPYTEDEIIPVVVLPDGVPPIKGAKTPGGESDVEYIYKGEQPEGEDDKQDGKKPSDKEQQSDQSPGDKEKQGGKSIGGKDKQSGQSPGDKEKQSGEGQHEEGRAVKSDVEKSAAKEQNTLDSHTILAKGSKDDALEVTEKIFREAERIRKNEGSRDYSKTGFGDYISKIQEIHKTSNKWITELKEVIRKFKMHNAKQLSKSTKTLKTAEGEGTIKSKSYFTWLKDPRSHSKSDSGELLFKGPYVKSGVNEIVVIVAIDTSGSITEKDLSYAMGELDKIAVSLSGKQFLPGMVDVKGRVYNIFWDTKIQHVDEYKAGDWKKYLKDSKSSEKKGIYGGGGTDPVAVFEYINNHLYIDEKVSSQLGVFNLLKKPTSLFDKDKNSIKILIDPKTKLPLTPPLLIFITDGEFSGLSKNDVGIYIDKNEEFVAWLIVQSDISNVSKNLYPKNNIFNIVINKI